MSAVLCTLFQPQAQHWPLQLFPQCWGRHIQDGGILLTVAQGSEGNEAGDKGISRAVLPPLSPFWGGVRWCGVCVCGASGSIFQESLCRSKGFLRKVIWSTQSVGEGQGINIWPHGVSACFSAGQFEEMREGDKQALDGIINVKKLAWKFITCPVPWSENRHTSLWTVSAPSSQ